MSLSTVPTQVKYGLIKKSQPAASKAPVRPKPSAFRDALEDDSEDEEMTDIGRVNAQLRKKNEQNQAKLETAATETDIYDYDGSYDTFKAAAVTSHPLSQPSSAGEPKSQYVSSLMVTAKMREREKDRVYEKKLLKERKEEDELYGDQPKFVTNAYKQKLLEDQKWEYENRLADQLEENTDVRKKGMHGFYANLLTKNIAMGGNVENALSVYTAGSSRQNQVVSEELQQPKSSSTSSSFVEESSAKKIVSDEARPVAISSSSTNITPAISQQVQESKLSAKPAPSVEVNKTEDINSARERYLARKRKLQENS